ncbi:MAG: hypothetical protein COU51_05035 [Parcubacteria group bacterium CG10_big_fil_rev_8_21_14_0_10_36_14]|nr:MAG: hypothetical protein COU51_05035 [Parcubacteria group bacterium CG10_big_fil_rev_8_21_14_0_10_36_14]
MKMNEKQKARELRKQGLSMNEIRNKLKVSKSSVSIWVRDVELTERQKQELSKKGIKTEVVEKRRNTRLYRERIQRQTVVNKAKKDITKFSEKDLFLTGVVFYWAEGGKTQRGLVRFSNGDPNAIEVMMKFFRKTCAVPEKKFRGHIHIHCHLDVKKAEKYWSEVTKIPIKQFFKTYNKPNKSSKNTRTSLPYGTFDIYVCDTKLFLKLKGWAERVHELVTLEI